MAPGEIESVMKINLILVKAAKGVMWCSSHLICK